MTVVQYQVVPPQGYAVSSLGQPAPLSDLEEYIQMWLKLLWEEQGQLDWQKLAMVLHKQNLTSKWEAAELQIQNLNVASQ